MAQAEGALAALNAGAVGVLRVAFFATAGTELIPPALASLQSTLHGLKIDQRLADRDPALRMLRNGLVDAAVIESHKTNPPRDGR